MLQPKRYQQQGKVVQKNTSVLLISARYSPTYRYSMFTFPLDPWHNLVYSAERSMHGSMRDSVLDIFRR